MVEAGPLPTGLDFIGSEYVKQAGAKIIWKYCLSYHIHLVLGDLQLKNATTFFLPPLLQFITNGSKDDIWEESSTVVLDAQKGKAAKITMTAGKYDFLQW